ncbi:hypothetical protein NG895_02200 [Aeoliella sp. ICT_H6.2]|uniref:Uncharacterized protein n=1 Tax=Aeoliella straminimaris TaxID=2954799 RepID=A0A9X2F6S4_9BACT|nr:hypothetical protein [Aeoliella straminimaris]MCO6042708.1 hypothetical protein [Aeoliella straminimaris]
MSNMKHLLTLLTSPVDRFLRGVSIVVAYAASGVLLWLAHLPTPNVAAKQGQAWFIIVALPPWLLMCLIAIRSGMLLEGRWKWVAWLPLAVPTLYFTVNGLMQVDWSRLIGV